MFIGHFAVGFASKRLAPRLPLGVLMAAPLLLDLLWPVFLLLGWEHVAIAPGDTAVTPLRFIAYPYSHSLLMSVVWAAVAAIFCWWRWREGQAAVVIAVGVVSHWVLDFITHRPDLPLYPGNSPVFGLGLWHSVTATIVVESLLFAFGVWVYHAATRPLDRVGRIAYWTFVLFLVVAYFSNLFGPPPPSVTALAWVALSIWLVPFWANWFDRHRAGA